MAHVQMDMAMRTMQNRTLRADQTKNLFQFI